MEGKKLYGLIEEMDKKTIQPENQTISIIDLFDTFIYGGTPLYTCCMKAFSILEKINNKNNNKFLLIISDGVLDDKDSKQAYKDIKEKMKQCQATVICIYFNSSSNNKGKKEPQFFNSSEKPSFDEGAEFLFNISSILDYHNPIIKFFIKNKWKIPSNGIAKLFYEINNSDDLNQFINLLNQSLEYEDDPLQKINTIIGDAFLDKIIDENYIKQFKPENQADSPLCWAYAISASIYLTSIQIFGRKIKSFENILKEVIKIKEDKFKGPVKPSNFSKIVERIVEKFKLRVNKLSPEEARESIMKGRQCLCYFCLYEKEWNTFIKFFEDKNNKNKIYDRHDIIINNNNKNNNKQKVIGHAVVLTSIEENCLKFLNSYGTEWGDNGYFRIKDHNSLRKMEFFDIYWEKKDLSKEEKDKYEKEYKLFIKQASYYLSQPDLNIKNDLEKEVKCQKCSQKLNIDNFELILYQKHKANDETDTRKPQIKCIKCNNIFESDLMMILLYIKYLII